jgi:hypothetical protein
MLALQAKVHTSFVSLERKAIIVFGTIQKVKREKFKNQLTLIFSSWENMGTMPERIFWFLLMNYTHNLSCVCVYHSE